LESHFINKTLIKIFTQASLRSLEVLIQLKLNQLVLSL